MTAVRYALILALVFLPASPFATTFPVTKTADTNGSCTPGNCSLREAIEAANANPGADDVPVPAGTYLLTLGQISISDEVSIAGAVIGVSGLGHRKRGGEGAGWEKNQREDQRVPNCGHSGCSYFDRAGPILSRRPLRWQEKYQEIAAFQLLLAEPVCYGVLRHVVDGSGGGFSRLGSGTQRHR